jgi:hypothetical protein
MSQCTKYHQELNKLNERLDIKQGKNPKKKKKISKITKIRVSLARIIYIVSIGSFFILKKKKKQAMNMIKLILELDVSSTTSSLVLFWPIQNQHQ